VNERTLSLPPLLIYTDLMAMADARNIGTAQITRKRFLAKSRLHADERTKASHKQTSAFLASATLEKNFRVALLCHFSGPKWAFCCFCVQRALRKWLN